MWAAMLCYATSTAFVTMPGTSAWERGTCGFFSRLVSREGEERRGEEEKDNWEKKKKRM